jgi:3-oxoacyl-[acyl-carrier protein] reductase
MDTTVALVSGASRGIGRAIADALAAQGAAVAIAARSREDVERAAAECPGRAAGYPLDVTDPAAVREVAGRVEAELGPIALLVNSAGVPGPMGPSWEAEPDEWWETVAIHLRGAFNCCHAVLPRMVERRRGRIVNLVSGLGVRDDPYVSAYSCAKAGMFRLTGVLAAEGAEHGVTTFALSPGLVRTQMTESSILGAPGRRYFPAFSQLPPDAFTEPEKVGALVVRIARGDADALSGRMVQVGVDLDESGHGSP